MVFYVGWRLPKTERQELLKAFPPLYKNVVAHHITLEYDVTEDVDLPTATVGQIVGIADDGVGVQALIVRINRTTKRPNGDTYHITWSIDRAAGRVPSDSNKVIAHFGWKKVEPVKMALVPELFGSS